MANQITKDGITIRSLEEIKDLIINGDEDTPGLQQIYGEDAVFDSDSPDGQLVGIFAQAIRDVEELALQVYSSFDPDQAVGTSLDNRVLYNGVRRKGATYTITPVRITTGDSEVSLKGLNEVNEYSGNLFTVFDNIGNEYYLINSHTIPANTTQSLSFRAKQIGQVQVTPNTITKSKSLINAIKSINNPDKAFVNGEDEETDEQLRIRRAKAVGYGLMGSVEVLQNAIRQLENVTDVAVFENNTDDGIEISDAWFPPHYIWITVEGGDDKKIASVIFLKLNSACGMFLYGYPYYRNIPIESVEGVTYYIGFNRPIYEPIFLKITAEPKNSRAYMNSDDFKSQMVKNTSFSIYSPTSTTDLDCIAKVIQDDFSYYNINIARKANALGYTLTGAIDYTDWTSITDGVLKVSINNGEYDLTFENLDFSGVASVSDIITVLSNAVSTESEAITDYVTITTGDNNNIIFDCINLGTDEYPSAFVPIQNDGNTGTDIFSLLGTLKQDYTISSGDWKELMFPETYQHKFTLSADDIILTIKQWGE